MDKNDFLQLLDLATAEEKIKLRVLWDAAIESLKTYRANYSKANLNTWQVTEQALEEYAQKIKTEETISAPTDRIPNLLSVLKYLKEQGYKVTKSTLYRHKDDGKLAPQENNSYTVEAVNNYAKEYLKKSDSSNIVITQKDVTTNIDADLRKKVAQAIHWETKTAVMRGLYAEVAIVERKHAGKASVLKSGIENAVRIRTPDSIHLAKGQDIYIPDVTEFWLNVFGELLDQYAEPIDFEVPSAADLDRIEEVDESK